MIQYYDTVLVTVISYMLSMIIYSIYIYFFFNLFYLYHIHLESLQSILSQFFFYCNTMKPSNTQAVGLTAIVPSIILRNKSSQPATSPEVGILGWKVGKTSTNPQLAIQPPFVNTCVNIVRHSVN